MPLPRRASRWWWFCSMAGRWPCRASRKRRRRFWRRGIPAFKAPMAWPTCCSATLIRRAGSRRPFRAAVGQVPMYYNHLNTGRPGTGEYKGTYVDIPTTPLYPFGFGLTYTTFEYGEVKLSAPTMKSGGTLTAKVNVKNTGSRAGTEVVQLYIRALAASAGVASGARIEGISESAVAAGRIARRKLHHFRAGTGLLRHKRPLAGGAGKIPGMAGQGFRFRPAGGF